MATSIDAFADGRWDEGVAAYRMDAKTLRLGQIDIAPADRAGIPALASIPHLTQEMRQEEEIAPPNADNQSEEHTIMDRTQVIREMTAEDARILPEPVRAAVLASARPPVEVEQIQSIRTELGLQGDADPLAAIREMRKTAEEQRKATISARISELLADPQKGIKVEIMRPIVRRLVEMRHPASVQEVDAFYAEAVASEDVTKALAGYVQSTMGPNQTTPVGAQNGEAKYFVIPEKEAA